MFDEIGAASIGLSPHRFSESLQHLIRYAEYNAGCVYLRNDETGRRCLADWRDDCFEWCAEQAQEDGRFMNQGYLNRWPERYGESTLSATRARTSLPGTWTPTGWRAGATA